MSYSIILSMAALQPEASMISLLKKINSEGQIIQDTGSGGAWPISTDRMIWTVAAWEIYKVTGDRKWLETVFPVVERSIAKDAKTIVSENGLVKGETSFIDWREQSYPKWMQTADISQSEAMGTNVLYAAALKCASEMAGVLGKKKEAAEYLKSSQELSSAIDKTFWMPDKGYYGMYTYGRDNKILNPRAETLGEALSILYDIAPAEHLKSISESNPVTKFGPAIFYPQISDMPSYHNNVDGGSCQLADHREIRPAGGGEDLFIHCLQKQTDAEYRHDPHILESFFCNDSGRSLQGEKWPGNQHTRYRKHQVAGHRQENAVFGRRIRRSLVFFPQTPGEPGIHTHARSHPHGNHQVLPGKCQGHRRQGVLTETRHEDRVHHVVQRLHQHGDHHGHRHGNQQPVHRLDTHFVFVQILRSFLPGPKKRAVGLSFSFILHLSPGLENGLSCQCSRIYCGCCL